MKCVICKNGETAKGVTTLTLANENATFVVRNVPAEVCSNCGEAYVDQQVTHQILETARSASNSGVKVDIREYKAA